MAGALALAARATVLPPLLVRDTGGPVTAGRSPLALLLRGLRTVYTAAAV